MVLICMPTLGKKISDASWLVRSTASEAEVRLFKLGLTHLSYSNLI